jgi:hypothetical protein
MKKASYLKEDARPFFLAKVLKPFFMVVMPASSTRPCQTLQGYAGQAARVLVYCADAAV